jgi:ABC-type bacteriocin/lantibiotic exporter with double-glycine peptidase domain
MVLSAYGVQASENELRKACRWDPLLATSSTAVVAAARQMGFTRSHEDHGLRLYDLRDLLRRGVFPILSIQLQPYGLIGDHSQVVVGITAEQVEVYDPLLGPMKTKHRTLDGLEARRLSDDPDRAVNLPTALCNLGKQMARPRHRYISSSPGTAAKA